MVQRNDEDADRPGPHPPPPEHGFHNSLPLVIVRPPWFRSHSADREAIYFGRSKKGRFADPAGLYGILYIGEDAECAFIETFGQALGIQTIEYDDLAARTLSIISASRSINLVDLTGPGLAQIGADARLFAAEHRISQLWSRAFYDHHSQPDGILYRARHDPSRRAIALFERADLELWSTQLGFDVLGRVLATYRFALVHGTSDAD